MGFGGDASEEINPANSPVFFGRLLVFLSSASLKNNTSEII